MTIAMCFLAPEGVVLGADSTSSASFQDGGFHYFNHNQKLFEIGENSSLGLLTWGLGGLRELSYRTVLALVEDELQVSPAKSVQEVAERWATSLWEHYTTILKPELARIKLLEAKSPYVPNAAPPDPSSRSEAEEEELQSLRANLYVGFCIAGYCMPDRIPKAFKIEFIQPCDTPPVPEQVVHTEFWGAPNFILRTLNGFDWDIREDILTSGLWSGTPGDLDAIFSKYSLQVPAFLPIRDAIDFVYSSIHSTIKALKFSSLNQICGGPIEVAVITTDRKFRWVRHKDWKAAIVEGETS